MKIKYDQKEVKQLLYSAIFLLLIILIFIVITIKDKDIALGIIMGPFCLWGIYKILRIIEFCLKTKRNNIFLELTEEILRYHDIREGTVEVPIQDIESVMIDTAGMHYSINTEGKRMHHSNKILILGNKQEMQQVFESIKKCSQQDYSMQNKNKEFANWCGACMTILVGMIASFFLFLRLNDGLYLNVKRLLIFLIWFFIVYRRNKNYVILDKMSLGKLALGLSASFLFAEYILCACMIQDELLETMLVTGQTVSNLALAIWGVIYLLIVLLYLPSNALGKKLILWSISKRTKTSNYGGKV